MQKESYTATSCLFESIYKARTAERESGTSGLQTTKVLRNPKTKDKMMKITVLLLAFAVFVSGNPVKDTDKTLLGELVEDLSRALSRLPKEPTGKEHRLKDLGGNGLCPMHMFCQAEDQLLKLSSLTKYNDFRKDGRLMRQLNQYNQRHEKTCKPVDEDQDEILVHDFLVELKKCVQNAYSKPKHTAPRTNHMDKQQVTECHSTTSECSFCENKLQQTQTGIAQVQSNSSVSGNGTLSTTRFTNFNPVKDTDKILLGELVEDLSRALSRLPKEPTGKEHRLKDLGGNGLCPKHMFCQAEDQLLKLSGLNKYNDFRKDGRLMRTLNQYNQHHKKTGKPVDEDQDEILVHDFLVELKKCVQNAYSKAKIAQVQSNSSVSGNGTLSTTASADFNPVNDTDRTLLGELVEDLSRVLSRLPKEPTGKEHRLKDLGGNGLCPKHMFSQAEDQLLKLSGLNKYNDFRKDGRLMRTLNQYNQHHKKTGKPVDEDQNEILVHDFLGELKKCVENAYSKAKIAQVQSNSSVSGNGTLSTTRFTNFNPVKDTDKTLLGELVEDLSRALSRLPKEPTGKEHRLKDLGGNGLCPKHMFSQAEDQLLKLSVLTKYNDFRKDGRLMRTLNQYNQHHKKTCKPVDEDQDEILVHDFLVELKKCVQNAYSKAK
ncbi:interleukin-13 [Pseudorasbora parva]|uniref:interleukin-13 n=1 Tax=Pseudorasbora parva TaxID=51549 RepID=UPI00351F0AC4